MTLLGLARERLYVNVRNGCGCGWQTTIGEERLAGEKRRKERRKERREGK